MEFEDSLRNRYDISMASCCHGFLGIFAIIGLFVALVRYDAFLFFISFMALLACLMLIYWRYYNEDLTNWIRYRIQSDRSIQTIKRLEEMTNNQVHTAMQQYIAHNNVTFAQALQEWGITATDFKYYTHRPNA